MQMTSFGKPSDQHARCICLRPADPPWNIQLCARAASSTFELIRNSTAEFSSHACRKHICDEACCSNPDPGHLWMVTILRAQTLHEHLSEHDSIIFCSWRKRFTMGTGMPAQPDLDAIRELEALRKAFQAAPGNHQFRFQHLFLNVVDHPAARIRPQGAPLSSLQILSVAGSAD